METLLNSLFYSSFPCRHCVCRDNPHGGNFCFVLFLGAFSRGRLDSTLLRFRNYLSEKFSIKSFQITIKLLEIMYSPTYNINQMSFIKP